MKTNIIFDHTLSILLRMWNFSDNFLEKTYILYSVIFFVEKFVPFMRYDGKIWYGRAGHRWQYGARLLHDGCYKHTFRICNTHCFSTATLVVKKHLNLMSYVYCLSCYIKISSYRAVNKLHLCYKNFQLILYKTK